jgi:hypothetical protein
MRPKVYPLLEQCIESGVAHGLRRAYKHDNSPSEEFIASSIVTSTLEELSEWFEFEDDLR